MPTNNFVKVAKIADIPEGKRQSFEVFDKTITIFNVNGKFYAVDDFCPHMAAPLSEGELNGMKLTCIWHEWEFDLETGECFTGDANLVKYPIKIDGKDLMVAV